MNEIGNTKKIVYISPYYDPKVPSGANRRFDEICKRLLSDFGDNFTLMVSKGKVPGWWNGGNLIEINYEFNHLSKFKAEKEITNALNKLPPSIVIMESIPIPFRALKRHKHFQAVYDFRYFYGFSKSFFYRLFFTQYLKYQWRNCQHIITCSEFSIDELNRHIGYPRTQVVKSFFGINDEIFNVARPSMDQKEYDLIYVGHFDGHKNHAPLIEALGMMDKQVKVLFIGVDNGKLEELKTQAVGLGLQNITFTKINDEKKIWEMYTKSKVFVSPSIYEGFGMPTIEALALGLPVVLSDIKVFHEVAGDLATYFDPYNPLDIKAKLEAALKDPIPPEKEKVRNQLDQFTWGNIYKNFMEDLKK